jgi:hypothetical protein
MKDVATGWGLPDEEYMSCNEGLAENHRYWDLRWMDWSDYENMCRDADRLIELQEEHPDEDALSEVAGDNMVYYLDLDPEVASVVVALVAIGAVPFTSCSGNAGHHETHPLVGFWAAVDLKESVQAAAQKAGVDVEAVGSALVVYHLSDSRPLRDFAHNLKEQHATR